MLDSTTKQKIANARQILVGKVPNPMAQVEQITIALIYKFMGDMDAQSEAMGGQPAFFKGDFSPYAWAKLLDPRLSGEERLDLYVRAITQMSKTAHIPSLFRDIFKGAFLPHNDPRTLMLFLNAINRFDYDNSENLGDAFEHLLLIMGSQGDAGQFRTPRHIIDFIVTVVAPTKTDRILDPACGTAGFLISAYKHILKQNNNELTPDEKNTLAKRLVGYDISPDMVRLALTNMYLHGFQTPQIYEYDTLTNDSRWDDDFDVLLANPPFMTPRGGIEPHNRFAVQANRAEVLFVDYIAEHATIKGRGGFIVPEGIIFQASNAYKKLRQKLIDDWGLYAVVSLPSGVFQPYSGVKTSILFFDKDFAKRTDEILFVKIQSDGFDLGAQRKEIDKNDLPDALAIFSEWRKKRTIANDKLAHSVKKTAIAEGGQYNFTGDLYREAVDYSNAKWPMVELGEVCEIYQPKTITSNQIRDFGEYEVFGANGVIGYFDEYNHEASEVAVTCRGATCGTVNLTTPKSWITGNAMVVKPKGELLDKQFLFYLLQNSSLTSAISGTAQPQITRISLSPFKIPLPPLEIQKQIVTEIEQYQKVIDGAKQVIENWSPSFHIDPNWQMVELGEVAEYMNGYAFKPKDWTEIGVPIIRIQNLTGTSNKANKTKREDVPEKYLLRDGDLLISWSATIGFYIWNGGKAYLNQHIFKVFPKENILKKYLFYLGSKITGEIKNKTHGNTMTHITKGTFEAIKIPLPPLEVQNQIVAEIEAERKAIDENKKLIATMEKKIEAKIAEVWGG